MKAVVAEIYKGLNADVHIHVDIDADVGGTLNFVYNVGDLIKF